jgi:hypothetical protein
VLMGVTRGQVVGVGKKYRLIDRLICTPVKKGGAPSASRHSRHFTLAFYCNSIRNINISNFH